MTNDPIVDEIRRIRDEHAAAFNYDIDSIYRDLKRQERESGLEFVSFPPRRLEPPMVLPPTDSSAVNDLPGIKS